MIVNTGTTELGLRCVAGGASVGLFRNNHTVHGGTQLANLVQPTFAGYANKPVVFDHLYDITFRKHRWRAKIAGQISYQLEFMPSADSAELIYGWFCFFPASSVLVMADNFLVPFPVKSGNSIDVQVDLYMTFD